MKHWPFKVINDRNKPKIQVEYKNQIKLFTPEELSSMILAKMKNMAEIYLGKKVSEVVITIPTYFNYSQRQAIKDAGTIAGLNVLRVLYEPAAAAIAYGLIKKISDEQNILVFDLGASNVNVTILNIVEGVIEVKSIAGNTHLGGEDFVNRMVEYFIQEFQRKYHKNLLNNKRALQRLHTACEYAKINLSSSCHALIEIDSLHEGIDFYSKITRECFEELNADLFPSIFELIEKALRDARMNKASIDEIILVGGSTRIPKVQKLLHDFFNGKELNKLMNPDETIAYGAAIQAAILTGDKSEEIQDLLLYDVVPFSLASFSFSFKGIETIDGVMTILIKRNTLIPINQTQTFPLTSFPKSQSGIIIKVFEGENPITKDNNLLDSFEFSDISQNSNDGLEIKVTFDIDANNILTVSVMDKTSGKEKKMLIKNKKERLSKDEIECMIFDAEKYKKEDEIRHNRIEVRNSLESYCFKMKTTINNDKLKDKINIYDEKKMIDILENTLIWLEKNQFAEQEEFENKLNEVEKLCSSIMMKSHLNAGKMSEGFSHDQPKDKIIPPVNAASSISKSYSRFLDIRNEHQYMLLSIEGYKNIPLLFLEDTIKHLENMIPNVRRNAWIAKERSITVADGLTQDESAAIQLYTMEWIPSDQSFYIHINTALREANRDKLIPFLCYLKLVLTALWKLPSMKTTVWSGVKGDLSTQYPIGKDSCSESRQFLEQEKFLGKTGVKTLFRIECETGKSIRAHSYCKTENEILLLPATRLRVISQMDSSNGAIVIHLKEIKSPFPLLQSPFT
ncbi:unnamed protein product [Rotaria sordida]|uniref:NAD(P)(+)--arginine ADP-ribosyltransferase n=1 Tax=Rotaria sordida TaxID=392033 RepID=A0A814JHL1_9BILA|nr:unnamed protein product [Rotaria sordida]